MAAEKAVWGCVWQRKADCPLGQVPFGRNHCGKQQAGSVPDWEAWTGAGFLSGPVAAASLCGKSPGTGVRESGTDLDQEGDEQRLLPRRHSEAGGSQLEGKAPRSDAGADQRRIPAYEAEPLEYGGFGKVQVGPGQRRSGPAPAGHGAAEEGGELRLQPDSGRGPQVGFLADGPLSG